MEGERMSNSIVYRKDVVEALYQALRTQLQGMFTDSMSLAISMANELPSAEKRGEWIINEEESTVSGSCSACGWQAHLYEDDVVGMNFCPNCGADMRGEDNV